MQLMGLRFLVPGLEGPGCKDPLGMLDGEHQEAERPRGDPSRSHSARCAVGSCGNQSHNLENPAAKCG